jgi:hypothetical protein
LLEKKSKVKRKALKKNLLTMMPILPLLVSQTFVDQFVFIFGRE